MKQPTPPLPSREGVARTAEHYTKQWGKELDFQGFVEASPDAAMVMPGRQLGWSDLFERIRKAAEDRPVKVYDAACGFGDIARRLLANPMPTHLDYLGVDIHGALADIDAPDAARFEQADISNPLAGERLFDFIVCRAALHHTPDPSKTFASLAQQLAPGGTLAVSVYARKAPMREAVDDALREEIVQMTNEQAMSVAGQFTRLGRDLQACPGIITITEDLPFLGIKAGTYPIQSFIYDHFIKCWFNKAFSTTHCDLVNFDWYHPPYAYRYTREELAEMATSQNLRIVAEKSMVAQHYIEARREQ